MKRNIRFAKPPSPLTIMIFIGILTALGSEIKILTSEESLFRFGLGTIIFFLCILIRPIPIFKTGLITAFIILLFRTFLDFFVYRQDASIFEHLPAALFYIVFAGGLQFINVQRLRTRPLLLGAYGAVLETIANTMEQLMISLFFTQYWLSFKEYLLVISIAFLRSYFVMGLFSTLALSEQKKRTEQLLSIGSDLYVETLYIQKSMENIERITADGFALYQSLKDVDTALSLKALMLSQEIHEVKKDSERIYAGLSKIVSMKQNGCHDLTELLKLIYDANMKYAESLEKDIHMDMAWQINLRIKEPMLVLALINNIVTNAIEAIEQNGWIHLEIQESADTIIFTIENNGPTIPEQDLIVILDPGYTTKFSASGHAATGIGLSHVKAIVQRFEGTIDIKSEQTTQFKIQIPIHKLI